MATTKEAVIAGVRDRLGEVIETRTGWRARCPVHQGRSRTSLSMREGHAAVLLHCFAGCTLEEVCAALGLAVRDLFWDSSGDCYPRRQARRPAREGLRQPRQEAIDLYGLKLDLLRAADQLIFSARDISIDGWTDERLDAELHGLADAYSILEQERGDDAI